MTITQIRYFLETADCQSFSEAAKRLYLTQPTLNRQITAIEAELNMQLFLRGPKGVRLTPGGRVLREELRKVVADFDRGVQRAEQISKGYSGKIKLGIVSGLNVSDSLRGIIGWFGAEHPNIEILFRQYGFQELLDSLYRREIDALISYDFHVGERPDIECRHFMDYHAAWAVPVTNPLAGRDRLRFSDMQEETLVIVREEDCPTGVQAVIDLCERYGGFYPKFHFVENMDTVYLWLKASNECALLNMENHLTESSLVKFFPCDEDETDTTIRIGWLREQDNAALSLLQDYLRQN